MIYSLDMPATNTMSTATDYSGMAKPRMCPICEARTGKPCVPVVEPGDKVVAARRYGRVGKRGGVQLTLERPGVDGFLIQLRPDGHP